MRIVFETVGDAGVDDVRKAVVALQRVAYSMEFESACISVDGGPQWIVEGGQWTELSPLEGS
jgi:hypothetical protein